MFKSRKNQCSYIMPLYLEHPNNQNQPEIPNHKPLIDNTF